MPYSYELRPSDILIERFQAWKRLVKNLIAYFEGIADIEVSVWWVGTGRTALGERVGTRSSPVVLCRLTPPRSLPSSVESSKSPSARAIR